MHSLLLLTEKESSLKRESMTFVSAEPQNGQRI
jgi:hypothetical protein